MLRLLLGLTTCELCSGVTGVEDRNKAPATVLLELYEDVSFLQVQINDSERLWFNVDSGAGAITATQRRGYNAAHL